MTFALPFRFELLVIFMDTVWFSVFPFIFFSIGRGAGLELMSFISLVGMALVYMFMVLVRILRILVVVLIGHLAGAGTLKSSNGRKTGVCGWTCTQQ